MRGVPRSMQWFGERGQRLPGDPPANATFLFHGYKTVQTLTASHEPSLSIHVVNVYGKMHYGELMHCIETIITPGDPTSPVRRHHAWVTEAEYGPLHRRLWDDYELEPSTAFIIYRIRSDGQRLGDHGNELCSNDGVLNQSAVRARCP